jgi:hypothetical protein
MRRWRVRVPVTVMMVVLLSTLALAQRGGGRGMVGFGGPRFGTNPPYDGRFTFTRIRYAGSGFGRGGGWWSHDYPNADRNLPLILKALTAIPTNVEASNILDLEDPEIFRNPILYVWEPGHWRISDEAAVNLRSYMLKGGLVIFDDFEANQWINFEQQFRRAMPEAEFMPLDLSHPVYHSFFDMETLSLPHPTVNVAPGFYGVHLDNDPRKRLVAIVNHNSDIAEYWEWSGTGMLPVDTTNDAYKIGVNYMIYGMTR